MKYVQLYRLSQYGADVDIYIYIPDVALFTFSCGLYEFTYTSIPIGKGITITFVLHHT